MKKFALAVLLAACALPAPASAATARLFHDTFDPSYRSPGGAVATGTMTVNTDPNGLATVFVKLSAGTLRYEVTATQTTYPISQVIKFAGDI